MEMSLPVEWKKGLQSQDGCHTNEECNAMNMIDKFHKTQGQRVTTFTFALHGEMSAGIRKEHRTLDFGTLLGGPGAHLEQELVEVATLYGRNVVFDIWAEEPANYPCEIVFACQTASGVELLRSCTPVVAGDTARLALYARETGELVSIGNDGRIVRQPLPGEEVGPAIRRGRKRLAKVRKRLARHLNNPAAATNDNVCQGIATCLSVMMQAA
jgi:hypothetical protein